ncbi:MAG TPA: hypothetical protein VHB46_01940 [Burkholderiales bacterium]|nr:hypothetical protein [Burkholderiales bacterium]
MIDFEPLLTLRASHAYYGGPCRDFSFFIPSATGRRLAGAHCLAKNRDGILTVLYERKEGGDALVSMSGGVIQVGLRLDNAHFTNFTELPPVFAEGLALYRNAGANPAALQAPVALLLNQANADDAELMREGLFCLVEIAIDAAFYASAPDFVVDFQAREETLKYYVVARNYTSAEFNQLAVTDEGFAADARPQVDFTRLAPAQFDEDDPTAQMLGAADARVAMFRSDQKVARRELARKRIQLARNNDPIISQLPQPGPADVSASLVIHLSKP